MILLITICSIIAFGIYSGLVCYVSMLWQKMNPHTRQQETTDYHCYSILIPFHNEESNINHCLESIINQHYSHYKFEIICINDHSTDNSLSIVQDYINRYPHLIRCFDVASDTFGKKNALKLGVTHAQYDYIITTDADTQRGSYWLKTIDEILQKEDINVIAAPVMLLPQKNNAFHHFQSLDYAGTTVVSMVAFQKGWFYNASGANIICKKSIYRVYENTLNPKEGHSGDDTFLLQVASKIESHKVKFAKSLDMVTYTQTEASWHDLLNQRKRWANKSFAYDNFSIPVIWLFVGFINVLYVIFIPLSIVLICMKNTFFITTLTCISFKTLADYILLKKANDFFKIAQLKYFLPASLFHSLLVLISGFSALSGSSFEWKGRKLNK